VDPFEPDMNFEPSKIVYVGHPSLALDGEKSWNVFLQNLNFSLSEERKSYTSWMALG